MQSLAYPQEHVTSANGWFTGRLKLRPAAARESKILESAPKIRRRRSILARRSFYLGLMAAAAWNMFAEGSPLGSLIGIATFAANVGVGAALLWALLEPPYFHMVRRGSARRRARAMLGRFLHGFAASSENRFPHQRPAQ